MAFICFVTIGTIIEVLPMNLPHMSQYCPLSAEGGVADVALRMDIAEIMIEMPGQYVTNSGGSLIQI